MSAVLVGLFGPMGSGKSYEAMEYHVIPALKAGQQVATNIKGIIEPDKIAYTAKYLGKTEDEVKSLLVYLPSTKEELFKPGVFPDTLDWSKPSLIPPGCLLVLDETATIFDKQPPDHILRYLTEQRHGVSPAGFTGRTIVISQSTGIHRSVRTIMSAAYVFSKFSMLAPLMKLLRPFKLGFDYRAEVYTDMSKTIGRAKPDNRLSRRYDLAVFPTYASVDATAFKQMGLDKRTTIFGSSFFVLVIPVALLLAWFAFSFLFDKFSVKDTSEQQKTTNSASSSPARAIPNAPGAVAVGPDYSQKLRLVGSYSLDGGLIYLIKDTTTGGYRYMSKASFKSIVGHGPALELHHPEEGVITTFSGASNAQTDNGDTSTRAK